LTMTKELPQKQIREVMRKMSNALIALSAMLVVRFCSSIKDLAKETRQ
jgi:hypothetical protein